MKANPADKVQHWDIDKLIPYARNSRTHSDEQVSQIAASMKEWGITSAVLVDEDGGIIAGHGRVMAAKKLGMTNLPVMVASGWTDSQKRAFVIADNKLALNAGWDAEMLALEVDELEDLGFDLSLTGFSDEELAAIEPEKIDSGLTDEDDVPEVPKEAVTRLGDIWILGNHRLMCGDSTDAGSVALLMNGQKADLCFTSPPYALGKSTALSGNKTMAAKSNPYEEHDDNSEQWESLMRDWFAVSSVAVSSAWVVNLQPLAGNKRQLMRWIADNADRLVDVVTWDKGHAAPQMAAGVLASRYEWMIVFSSKTGASRSIPLSSWRGTIQSVYDASPQRNNEFSKVHAATMPVHVPTWVMSTLCDKTKTVFEPFCGTGTTLIAAEKLNRKCYGMEISPTYCDVIVKRWQDFTGKKAVLESNGKTFDEVANG